LGISADQECTCAFCFGFGEVSERISLDDKATGSPLLFSLQALSPPPPPPLVLAVNPSAWINEDEFLL